MLRYSCVLSAVAILVAAVELPAGDDQVTARRTDTNWLLPVPELDSDPDIPTLKQVIGHDWGEAISSHAQIERYVRALASAAPNRSRLVSYGKTYEDRALYYLIVSSPENLARIEQIRSNNLRLADALNTSPEQARDLAEDSPAFVWLAYNIHGNEISTADAALVTAYHLLADRSEPTQAALEKLVVFIDPLQNPDGRERFLNVFRETSGRFPQSEPWSSEHTERWPGGRFNHYLFDMNRDWFLHSQRETQHKVAAYLRWHPHVFADAHEMGRNSTYYFIPPADPINPLLLPKQIDWLFRLGRRQATWFDRYGFPYTTREMFDAFYPGYGSEWPLLQGGLGLLWEQASARGLVIDRDDETKLYFRDGVRHHYISALALLEMAAENRQQLVWDFYQARRRGVQSGQEGPVKHFFLLEGRRPHRTFRLAKLLADNGVRVSRLDKPITASSIDIAGEEKRERTIPAGSYHVPVAQPAAQLVRALLDRKVDMDQEFVQRQLSRNRERLPDEIYDVTAWSLPLAFGVDCLTTDESLELDALLWDGASRPGQVVGGQAKVAYLVSGDDDSAMSALVRWLRSGLRVHVADRPLKLNGVRFPRGTLILQTHDNPAKLHDAVAQAAERFQIDIHATDTGFVTEGAHLGGPYVNWVRPPKVVLLVDRPTSYSVGHTWYLMDQVWRYPVTRVAGRNLGRLDLSRYNVLILPDGSYSGTDAPDQEEVGRIKEWVRRGGTLILVDGATAWATREEIGLLPTKIVKKPVQPADASADEAANKGSSPADADEKAQEPPKSVPGAFLRADVYADHWVTFGVSSPLDVFVSGNLILSPIRPDRGRDLVTFRQEDDLLTSGFCWPKTLDLLEATPYLVHRSVGSGHIVAFTGDPNYRAMYPTLQRLFVNAVMFGPGH